MKIKYPYLPKDKKILYVPPDNEFMREAKKITESSGCVKRPTGAVIIRGGKIIGRGANSGKKVKECPRHDSPTGENYGPCKKICKQERHAKITAIKNAKSNEYDTTDADLYLYGHWWCCENCWNKIIKAGIKNVYLLDKSWEIFNPEY